MRIMCCILLVLLLGCKEMLHDVEQLKIDAPICPDYRDVTVPVNIAPFHFYVDDYGELFDVHLIVNDETVYEEQTKREFIISEQKWNQIKELAYNLGKPIEVQITKKFNDKWLAYNTFNIYVKEAIDPYITYRLIPPGYENWDNMSLIQRDLTNFNESVVLSNKQTERSCLNCHISNNGDASTFVFHSRGSVNGTFVVREGSGKFIDGKTAKLPNGLTYASWHPRGQIIAFSSNQIAQFFHYSPHKQIEVYDSESDIVIYNTNDNAVYKVEPLFSKGSFTTYPQWNAAGDKLYYCMADTMSMPERYKDMRYMICSIGYDEHLNKFGENIDTVVLNDGSAVFPRLSPDGKYLSYTTLDYGCFPIWHREADIKVMDITSGVLLSGDLNSLYADSYHQWSSNSRWLMFTSRRDNDMFTTLYFSYISSNGEISKPFLLPQKDFDIRYPKLMSYNTPQFLKSEMKTSSYKLSKKMSKAKEMIVCCD